MNDDRTQVKLAQCCKTCKHIDRNMWTMEDQCMRDRDGGVFETATFTYNDVNSWKLYERCCPQYLPKRSE